MTDGQDTQRSDGSVILVGLLALIIPPFSYLYLQRPVLFAGALFLAVAAIPPSLHHQWIWLVYALAIAAHAISILALRKQRFETRWYATPIGLLSCLLVLTAGLAVLRVFFLDVHRVSSASMEPRLRVNDLVVVAKWQKPMMERGRVYTFRFDGDEAIYVKRLIGTPGDLVTLRGNLLELNGTQITQADGADGLIETLDGNGYAVLDLYNIKKFRRDWLLEDDQYFFLGDNRSNSIDSRIKGSVPLSSIIGEAIPVSIWWSK